MTRKAFEWEPGAPPPRLEEHSARKLDLVRFYLRAYLRTIGQGPRQDRIALTLVDGFAGAGTFLRRGVEVGGTPLVMMEEVEQARRELNQGRAKPLAVEATFVFVEKRRATHEHLRQVLLQRGLLGALGMGGELVRGDFVERYASIKERVMRRHRAGRSIFLLDQLGWNAVPFDVVRDILTTIPKSEVILTFNVDWLIDHLADSPEIVKAVQPLGMTRGDVQDLLARKAQAGGRILAQQVLARRIQAETRAPNITPFFVRSASSHRSMWIVHLSEHPKARDVMLDQHWALGNGVVHQGPGSLDMIGWTHGFEQLEAFDFGFDEVALDHAEGRLLSEIPEALWRDGLADGLAFEAWRAERVNRTALGRDHLCAYLGRLAEAGEIRIETRTGRTKRPGARLRDDDVLRTPAQRPFLFAHSRGRLA